MSLAVAECNRLQPGNTDVNICVTLVSSGNIQLLALGAPEPTNTASYPSSNRSFMLSIGMVQTQVDTHIGDIGNLFIKYLFR